jgi:hypothetical protein
MLMIQMAVASCTFFVGICWFIYDYCLMKTVMPNLDAKNEELCVLRSDTYFAKSCRSAVYMYASAFPNVFVKNRRKLKFTATERERFLYKINGYLGLAVAFGFCSILMLEWLLDHRIDW